MSVAWAPSLLSSHIVHSFPCKRRSVGAPYAIVPPNATLQYEVELIRLSARGPDELTQGISRCGAGGASGSAEQCEQIEVAEFL